MPLKHPISKEAFRTGLILAAASVLASAAAVMLTWRLMDRENRAFVQQSIGDTTELLALHVREEFQRLGDEMRELGEANLKAELLKAEMAARSAAAAPALPGSPSGSPPSSPNDSWVNAPKEFLDLALWVRPNENAPAERRLLAMNSLDPEPKADWAPRLRARENEERERIGDAFKGHMIVLSDEAMAFGGKPVALVAVPLGHGMVSEVVVAHIRIDSLRKDFQRDGMIRTLLVDSGGAVLAQDDAARFSSGGSVASSPLFQAVRTSELMSAQQSFADQQGVTYFGGFRKIPVGELAILAAIPESEATSGLHDLRNQSVLFLMFIFLAYLGAGYAIRKRRPRSALAQALAGGAPGAGRRATDKQEPAEPPQRKLAIALHGSLRRLTQLIDSVNPEDAAEAINDFLSIAAARVRKHGGRFERYAGASFVAVWCSPHFEGNEPWRALRCALELCEDLARLNESRKVDGHKALAYGMGIHTGIALGTQVGEGPAASDAFFGEVIICARSLDHLASASGSGLLVSQEVWEQCGNGFVGERMGEAKLTPETGLTGYFAARGYRDEQGKEAVVLEAQTAPAEPLAEGTRPHIVLPEKKDKRWLLNNGSQIVGPFSAREIASLLFAQELDFDCECWMEGTGQSAQVKDAGIFTGSNDAGASLWVFDGETVHGPVSPGFINTAVDRGAINPKCHVCEGSTIQGWMSLEEWRKAKGAVPQNPPATSATGATGSGPKAA